MTEQRVDLVRKQFELQLDAYTGEKRIEDSRALGHIVDFLNKAPVRTDPFRLCEFGGADGILLDAIRKRAAVPVELTNAELVEAYREKQCAPDIRFVQASILQSEFADQSFDVVVARNVIHHLIGDDLDHSRRNQRRALETMRRVTRPGGVVVIEEMVNQSRFACALLYYMSRTAAAMRLNVKTYGVTPHTVVAFMTENMVHTNFEQVIGIPDLHEYWPSTIEWYWKITGLRRKSGLLVLLGRVRS